MATDTFEAKPLAACSSCAAPLQGRFCHACGEKTFDPRDHSVKYFLGELLRTFTHLDSKFLQSLRLLFVQPGLLTREYLSGRKKRHTKPLAIFIIANVVFFLSQTWLINLNSFDTRLISQMHWQPYSSWIKPWVEEKIVQAGLDFAAYERLFDAKSEHLGKTLVIFQIPVWALLVQVLHFGSRRYYFDHLIFATHYYAFMLYLNILVAIAMFIFIKLAGTGYNLEIPFVLVLIVYLFFALRQVYQQRKVAASLKGILLAGGTFLVLWLYRFALFLVTFYTL